MNTELTRPAQRDPLHDWRVRAKASSVLADVALAADLPLVGREDILLQLERQAARAAAGGVSVVALTGEPGLGKTRVLRAFEERARARGVDVVWADAEPGIASRPAGPLVVLCDGVQAASRLLGSVDLGQEQVHQGALFVVAYSPGDVQGQARHPVHEWLAAAARRFELVEVDLPALSNPELAELMTHAGGGGPPDQELLHVLSSLSEGNPYFALQTLLDLTRSRLVSYEQSTWRLQGHLPVDYLPAPIASLAAHQTSALDAATAMTLASAAVIGPGFQFDLLVTICGKSPEEVLGHLEDGLAHEIIREAAEPPDDFHFVHELVRRSLYRHLSSIRRRQLHQAIASALESESAGSKAEEPDRSAVLAHHYGRGRDPELAFHHTLRALHRAESLGAWEDAVRRCREALEFGRLAECGEDIELQLLTHLGGLYLGRAQTFAAGTCWREALRICDSVGDLHRRAVLMAHLAALGPGWLSIEQAEGALVEAESAPQPAVGPAGLAVWAFDAYMNLGLAKERYGRMPEAMTYLRRAVDLTRVSDPWSRGLALANLGSVLTKSGQAGEAVDVLRAALELLKQSRPPESGQMPADHLHDPRRAHCLALADFARALAYVGDLDEALELAEQAQAEEERLGIRPRRSHRAIAQIELRRRRPAAALEALARAGAYAATELLGVHRVADILLMSVAQLETGDVAAALQTARDGVRICKRTGTREYLAGLYVAAGQAQLAQGDRGGAMEAAERAMDTITETGTLIHRLDVLRLQAAIRRGPATRLPEASTETSAAGLTTRSPSAAGIIRRLSQRELEVLALVADGQSNRRIAEALIVSDKTVKRHLSNILDKLGVSTRAAAVNQGMRLGLL